MHDLAKNATRIGLSKTANKKVIAKDAIWQDAFGGMTDKPGTTSNANGGIKYGSPNLTQMDLHNLNTAAITNMSALFNGGSNLTTVGDLSDWNTSNVTTTRTMFQTASNLTNIGNLDNWDTRRVTDMTSMFNNVYNLTNIGDLSKWQTGNVTNMHNMFTNATSLTNIGNLDNWNTNKVTDMRWMFGTDTGKQSHLTNIGDLSKWQTGNVTNMHDMFTNATNLTNIGDLSKWQTGNVTDMSWMFGGTTNLTNIGDLSKWQTGNVTDMNSMFYDATNLTNIGNLDNWDTSKVTDMHWMFGTKSDKQSHLTNIGDLSKWQTSNVTDMNSMFCNATNLTNIGNLDNWDTGKVIDMASMFGVDYSKQSHLTHIGDLSKWDTSHVTDMNNMFANKALLHLNISNWNLTKLANKDAMKYMFANVTNLTVIANDLKLPTWYQNEVNDADSFWNNHIAVITNVPELIKATGDIDNLKIDDQDASRSIFYDSKGSNDAIQVLKDANNQYIADYHKANPTKVLKLADTVDQNDPIALANASFITIPAAVGLTVHFEDVDPNADKDSDTVKQELVKTVKLSGHSGDTADLSQVQLPTNFELSGDLPSAAFGNTDSVTIQLKHKLSDNTYQEDNGQAVANTDVIAPDGTILITGSASVQSFIDQRQDLVTGQMVNGDTSWSYNANSQTNVSSDILNKYIEQYNPTIMDNTGNGNNISTESWYRVLGAGLQQPLQIKLKAGYTVDRDNGNYHGWDNWSNNDTYTYTGLQVVDDWNTAQQLNNYTTSTFQIIPLDQLVHYQFIDNGTQVGSDVIITGKTDETVSLNLSIPENYELADGTTLPTSYTFAATNPTIQINLKHKLETSVESLPATRTINVHLPNGTTKIYQQIIGYQRDVITDLVTKAVTRGTWTVNDVTSSFTIDGVKQLEHSYVLRNGNYNFAGIKLPKVPGYKAKVSKNNGLLLVSYLALAPEKPEINTNSNELQFSNSLAGNSTVKSDLIIKSDMYQVVNDNHNWQLPVIKNYELKFATNKNQIIFVYTKDKQNDYRFILTFKDNQYSLATFDKENKLLKTYSIKSYDELAKIINSLVLMNVA